MSLARSTLARPPVLTAALLAVACIALSGCRPLPAPRAIDAGTGVPAGTTLTPAGPQIITSSGAVVDGLDIHGRIEVRANKVTIRRTRVTSSDYWPIRIFSGYVGTIIEDVEVVGVNSSSNGGGQAGILGDNYTALRDNIHGTIDGLRVGANTVVQDSWVHDLVTESGSHSDAIQSQGGAHIRILGNDLAGPFRAANSSLLLAADSPGSDLSDVIVEGNVFSGGAYSVYVRHVAPHAFSDVHIRNNRWIKGSAVYGPTSIDGALSEWVGNTWDDSAPINGY
jgi:hypothetical protein